MKVYKIRIDKLGKEKGYIQVSELPKDVNEAVMYHLIATLPYKPYFACEPFLVRIERLYGEKKKYTAMGLLRV
ncbi:hypothetical protein P4313_26915, partial [Bacillus tropicus]|uniref:hypothetical protein n=1 Tax=Bacillus tropicus TaxID=2026188 RepID=UPI002E22C888|nr:hypothetical protein [Bacillus tropicus]